jgi:hypothetical protein
MAALGAAAAGLGAALALLRIKPGTFVSEGATYVCTDRTHTTCVIRLERKQMQAGVAQGDALEAELQTSPHVLFAHVHG